MKTIANAGLLQGYLSAPPYTDYFDESLGEHARLVAFEAGETVIRQDVSPEYLCLMVSGRCCVRALLANGKSVILRTLEAPCLIGEMELMREVSAFTVRTLEKCRMLAIPMRVCRERLPDDARFLRRLCCDLIFKERTEAFSLLHSFAYPLENRLARFILDNRQGNRFFEKKVLVAESLGVSYRHLSKVLGDFVEKQYLTKTGLVYTIANRAALEALARELEVSDLLGDAQ